MSDDDIETNINDELELEYQAECDKVDEDQRVDNIVQMVISLERDLKEYVHRYELPFLQFFDVTEWITWTTCTNPLIQTRQTQDTSLRRQ